MIEAITSLDFAFVAGIATAMLAVAVSLFAAVTSFRAARSIFASSIPVSHKIAVIGLPNAGKTTLITGLFELIQKGVHIPNVRLHGLRTIQTVNQNIARLHSGQPIGPTTEDTVFVFRFSYRKPFAILFSHLFDVEIADFPGEYTRSISSSASGGKEGRLPRVARRVSMPEYEPPDDDDLPVEHAYSRHYGSHRDYRPAEMADALDYTLFGREFFSWIASSSEYLFLVDIAAIYSAENVRGAIAELIARIRTSWQVIEDATTERGIGNASRREVHVVFTKVDSLFSLYSSQKSIRDLTQHSIQHERQQAADISNIKQSIRTRGKVEDLSGFTRWPNNAIENLIADNDLVFSDLYSFFRGRVRHLNVIYLSMVIEDEKGGRLGMREVLRSVLP